MLPGVALAQPDAGRLELLSMGVGDLPAWWSMPGRPGWTPDTDFGATPPWTLAGHVRGAWRIAHPGLADVGPFPGLLGTTRALAWLDSVEVIRGGDGAWRGYDASLGTVASGIRPNPATIQARGRSDFALINGSSAYEDYGLSVRRGGAARWLLAEAASLNRGSVGALGDAGRHLYNVAAGGELGDARVEASFGQRGHASELSSGEAQAASGVRGHVAAEGDLRGWRTGLALARAVDIHESFGPALALGRRDAHETGVTFEASRSLARGTLSARLDWRTAPVVRAIDGEAPSKRRARWQWGAAQATRALGEGEVEVGLGLGHHDAFDRFDLAPSLAYRFTRGSVAGRVIVERVLAPQWSDLASGQGPFLQSTWLGGIELEAGRSDRPRAKLAWLMGRTRDRALASRLPIEALWLRVGLSEDSSRYDFGLLTALAEWRGGPWLLGSEIYALARDPSPAQAAVDPGAGGRGFAQLGFRLFRKDLAVRLRLEAEAVGARESEAPARPRLAGFVTGAAVAELELDAVVATWRVTNLDDTRHPRTWTDPATGREAMGPGREFRFALVWRLID